MTKKQSVPVTGSPDFRVRARRPRLALERERASAKPVVFIEKDLDKAGIRRGFAEGGAG